MDFFVFVSEQWVLVSILVFLLWLFVFSERAKGGKPISVHQVTQLINADEAVLLDIRPATEFSAGHIVDAMHIPHDKVLDRVAELESCREKIIIIVDKIGQHAGHIGKNLREKGFEVFRLDGGMLEWQNQNLPVVKK